MRNNPLFFDLATVAQLVERLLAKEKVAGSNPVRRSRKCDKHIFSMDWMRMPEPAEGG